MNDKILNNINNVLLSALTVKQKQLVDKILEKNGDVLKSRYDHIFGVGNNRLYLNDIILIDKENTAKFFGNQFYYPRIYDVEVCIKIYFIYLNKSLSEDFELKSIEYLEGKFKVDNREYSIGKILNELKNNVNKIQNSDNIKKIQEEKGRVETDYINFRLNNIDKYLKNFNTRPVIKNIECQVVISRDPYDIAGMSTDRKWHSCMELKNENENYDERSKNQNQGGVFRYYVKNDLTEGSLIAYLIDKKDREIEAPYARVLIKPYINRQGDQIFLSPEARVYKDDTLIDSVLANKFLVIVDDWAKEQQKDLKGKFYANPNLYYDGKSSIFAGKSLSIEEAVYKSIKWNTLFKQDKMIIKDAIKTNYISNVDDLIEKYNGIVHEVLFKNKIYMPFIDASKIKNENYLNLEFPVRILSDEEKNHIRIYYYYKLNYNLFPTHEFISFDEIARQLKKEEKIKNKTGIQNFINDLENISTDDRFDTERYDIIITRSEDTNNNDLMLIEQKDYIDLTRDEFASEDTQNYYLYTVYLVSSGVTDLNKALIKIYMNLVIDDYRISSEYSYDIIHEYDDRDFLNSDADHRVLLADISKLYIHPEFDNYLNYKNEKNNNYFDLFKENLTDAILDPIDKLQLDVYLLTSLYDFDLNRVITDDRYVPASEKEIFSKGHQTKKEFRDLEKEVFGDSSLDENKDDYF